MSVSYGVSLLVGGKYFLAVLFLPSKDIFLLNSFSLGTCNSGFSNKFLTLSFGPAWAILRFANFQQLIKVSSKR